MKSFRSLQPFLFALALIVPAGTSSAADSLEQGFLNPPHPAQPQTWWHWMNGNITREGITADLEAMKRVGIGGAQIFNVDSGIPHGPVQFMSSEWRDMFRFAAAEANRLGIELCLHNCAGWSSSGGPWNTPEHAMQHVTSREVSILGPTNFSGTLPQPPSRLGFYRDIAVLAFRTPDGEGVNFKMLTPKITSSTEPIDGASLIDGRASTFVTLPAPSTNRPQYIQIQFDEPFAARTIVLTPRTNANECRGVIQVSDDGRDFRDLRPFAFGRRPTRPLGVALGPQSAGTRFYRILFTAAARGATEFSLADIDLSPRLRIENFETKDGDTGGFVASSPAEEAPARSLVVNRSEIVDLTDRLGADGRLDWDVPAGNWTILRLGYTPTGRENHPAPPEGTGPECDKLSAAALDAHWDGFVGKVLADLGSLAGRTLNNVLIDSYEVGGQNWSANFAAEFRKRRGYDLRLFLPTFTGRVVDDPAISERFLWDVRRTIADLFAENYYGHFQKLCNEHGLTASIEPYTGPFESLQCGAAADIPMGEFWLGQKPNPSVKLAASVGHIYGRTIIGAESFTAAPGPRHGRWLDDAYAMKALGDLVFCQGVNRFILHRYAMQPWTNRWPGMTMGQWGTHFDRTSTWWEQGRAWLQYVARCQFLLQQGRFVADVAFFCGESAPAELRVDRGDFAVPTGYDYDGVNADVLRGARIERGRLVLKSGMSYRALVLPPSDRNLRPELLRKLHSLVADGLTLVGYPPDTSPSLQNFPRCDVELKQLVDEMWGDRKDPKVKEHRVGKGRVAWDNLANVLSGLEARPDFEFARDRASDLAFIHRSTGDTDIYFVSNQRDRFDTIDCTFRIAGKQPELWHPDTGTLEPAPVWREQDGRTTVSLPFDPAGSVFVVFRAPAHGDHWVAVQSSAAQSANSSPPSASLRILKAVYGPVGGVLDVTSAVQSQVAQGKRTIAAGNDLTGDDPAPGVVKQLRVEFAYDGKRGTVDAVEGKDVVLPSGKIQIVKAVYGSLPTGQRVPMDVTAKVRSMVAAGTLEIPAGNDLAGEDPAPYIPKRLQIEFRVHGQPRFAEADEGGTVVLPPDAEVRRAAYGPRDPEPTEMNRSADLTRTLANLVREGKLNVMVDNDLADGDPAPNIPKQLTLDYSLDGTVKHVVIREGDPLSLGAAESTTSTPPSFRAQTLRDGRPQLVTGVPDTFTVTWASGRQTTLSCRSVPAPVQIGGAWQVNFPPGWGAPATVVLDSLQSWSAHSNPGVKYFSGTAVYRKDIEIPAALLGRDQELWLDLGAVKNFAEVSMNGKDLGILWKPPFRVDLRDVAKPGRNHLEIKVTNLWPNRLIGDEQLPADCAWEGSRLRSWPDWLLAGKPSPTGRLTFTTWHHWTKDAPLLESGLLGPVTIEAAVIVPER